jgi:GT2 family glycosyltransferase
LPPYQRTPTPVAGFAGRGKCRGKGSPRSVAGKAAIVETPKVFVLILTWNTCQEVLTCVEHALGANYPNYQVVVIDNASQDGTSAAVRHRYPNVTLLENSENLGYAAGNNRGIKYALEHGAEYVLIINSDTVMPPDLLTKTVQIASSSDHIAAVGVKNLKMSDPSTVWAAYLELTYRRELLNVVGREQPDSPALSVVKDVPGVSGACMLLSRRAVEDVGLLDETFFMYHEDLDWCQRAISKGYRCVYAGTAHILHKGSSSTLKTRAGYYFLVRNSILFARKHGNLVQYLTVVLSTFLYGTRKNVKCWLGLEKKETYSLLWQAFKDAITGRPIPLRELGLR